MNEITPKHFIDKIDRVREKLADCSGPSVVWMKEYEEDTKLVLPGSNFENGINTMTRALFGFDEGVAVIAGRPNSGKSTLMINMMMQSLQLNDDLIIVDLSFDDPIKKRFTQYVACLTGLSYEAIGVPKDATETERLMMDEATERIKELYTLEKLHTFESIERVEFEGRIKELSMRRPSNIFYCAKYLRNRHPDKKICFFVDAWNNIDFSFYQAGSDVQQANAFLRELQDICVSERAMFIVSAHLRKGMEKRPTLEDIKGTTDMAYNCVWAAIVKNEYRENVLTEPLMWYESGRAYPMIVVEIEKTKVSSWDYPIFYGMKAGSCQIIPLTRQEYIQAYQIYRGKRT